MPRREDYKNEGLNNARANFEDSRKNFGSIDFRGIMSGKTVLEKYETFLRK